MTDTNWQDANDKNNLIWLMAFCPDRMELHDTDHLIWRERVEAFFSEETCSASTISDEEVDAWIDAIRQRKRYVYGDPPNFIISAMRMMGNSTQAMHRRVARRIIGIDGISNHSPKPVEDFYVNVIFYLSGARVDRDWKDKPPTPRHGLLRRLGKRLGRILP